MDQDNSDDNATDYYSVRSESDNERITTKLHDNFILCLHKKAYILLTILSKI